MSKFATLLFELPLPQYTNRLEIKKEENQEYIKCVIRKKWIVFTPEEFVRQLLLQHFLDLKYPKGRIKVEHRININAEHHYRADIVIYNKHMQMIILVECKAAHIKINEQVVDQISRYNFLLRVPHLLVCNGPDSLFALVNFEESEVTFKSKLISYIELITG